MGASVRAGHIPALPFGLRIISTGSCSNRPLGSQVRHRVESMAMEPTRSTSHCMGWPQPGQGQITDRSRSSSARATRTDGTAAQSCC